MVDNEESSSRGGFVKNFVAKLNATSVSESRYYPKAGKSGNVRRTKSEVLCVSEIPKDLAPSKEFGDDDCSEHSERCGSDDHSLDVHSPDIKSSSAEDGASDVLGRTPAPQTLRKSPSPSLLRHGQQNDKSPSPVRPALQTSSSHSPSRPGLQSNRSPPSLLRHGQQNDKSPSPVRPALQTSSSHSPRPGLQSNRSPSPSLMRRGQQNDQSPSPVRPALQTSSTHSPSRPGLQNNRSPSPSLLRHVQQNQKPQSPVRHRMQSDQSSSPSPSHRSLQGHRLSSPACSPRQPNFPSDRSPSPSRGSQQRNTSSPSTSPLHPRLASDNEGVEEDRFSCGENPDDASPGDDSRQSSSDAATRRSPSRRAFGDRGFVKNFVARLNGPGSSEKKGEDGDGDTRKTGNVVSRIAESMRRKTSEVSINVPSYMQRKGSAMLSGSAGTPRVVLKSTTELPEESVAQETIESPTSHAAPAPVVSTSVASSQNSLSGNTPQEAADISPAVASSTSTASTLSTSSTSASIPELAPASVSPGVSVEASNTVASTSSPQITSSSASTAPEKSSPAQPVKEEKGTEASTPVPLVSKTTGSTLAVSAKLGRTVASSGVPRVAPQVASELPGKYAPAEPEKEIKSSVPSSASPAASATILATSVASQNAANVSTPPVAAEISPVVASSPSTTSTLSTSASISKPEPASVSPGISAEANNTVASTNSPVVTSSSVSTAPEKSSPAQPGEEDEGVWSKYTSGSEFAAPPVRRRRNNEGEMEPEEKGPVRSRCVGFHDVVTVFEDDVAGSLHLYAYMFNW